MDLSRRTLLGTSAALLSGACTLKPPPIAPSPRALLPGAPLKISADRLMKITVCTRPFRPAGPRIEAEAFGDKTVIHNYGHGGSGWSLSWACAEEAVQLAHQTIADRYAVIGAGVIGLTTALRLTETGKPVTIYAKELPSESRSARATGVWSPSSRIALHGNVPAGFEQRWEGWARKAYHTHQAYIGSLGEPVAYQPFYSLRPHDPIPTPAATHRFMHLDSKISDIVPGSVGLQDVEHTFPVARAREGLSLTFNIAAYTNRMVRDFLAMGGRIVRREFPDRTAVSSLRETVILNCTGYGAKALWGAEDLVPVRGQINWMPPQPEARYGLYYNHVYVLSRGDGIVVQYTGPNDDYGLGIADETPDREEMKAAIATVAPLFKKMGLSAFTRSDTPLAPRITHLAGRRGRTRRGLWPLIS